MPDDPTRPVMPSDTGRWPASFLERVAKGLKPAGVLIPLIDRQEGVSVLLTQRSSALRVHAGQVSFPGGGMESADNDIRVTALREAHEEVGIAPAWVEVAGFLDPSPTVSGYAVTPVVGLIKPQVVVTVDPAEVEAAFEVPLAFLLDEGNEQYSTREFEGAMLSIVEFNYADRRIWGATAMMLQQLRKILIK